MIKNIDKPEISRGLAKIFNDHGIGSLSERFKLIDRFDSMESLEKYLKEKKS